MLSMATTSKTQGTFFDLALAKEVMRGTNQGFVFSLGDAQFGKRELPFTARRVRTPTSARMSPRLKLPRLGHGRGWGRKNRGRPSIVRAQIRFARASPSLVPS